MAINGGNAYQQPYATNPYGTGSPQPNFVGQTYGNWAGQNYGQQGGMNNLSRPGLSVVPIDTDDQISNYPVASGNTVLFINFNTNRICFKSTNANGVTMPLQWGSFAYDQPQTIQQNQTNQNGTQMVSREEFDELKAMMQQTLNAVQNQNFQNYKQKPRYDKQKGGFKDDRSNGIPADDE